MTREEYEKLVKSAMSFRTMAPDVQARILAATGAEMEKYIEIFQEEMALIGKANQNFQQETQQIVTNCKVKVQKKKVAKLKAKENVAIRQDLDTAESLLKKI